MSQSRIVGAIEIGTSSVKVLIGDIVNGRSLNIIGMGHCSSRGLKKGEILDFKAASNCAHAAIMGAEKSAGVRVESMYLAQTGRHLSGKTNIGSINVGGADGIVRSADIDRVRREAKAQELPASQVYIHHMQNAFSLDGEMVGKPLGAEGERLEVGYWSVYGNENKIRDHVHVINGFGLNVDDMIISSIASGVTVTTEEQKKEGVLVLDMGGGTTDWVVYKNGCVERTGVLAVGGQHLINDIALGLRVSRKNAERMLLQFGKAVLEKEDRGEKVWMVGDQMIGDQYMSKQALVEIIQARSKELFELVKADVGENCNTHYLSAGAILTGGMSRLPQIEKVASRQLGLKTVIGENPSWVREDLREVEFSTCLGLLHYALTEDEQAEYSENEESGGLLKRVASIFIN